MTENEIIYDKMTTLYSQITDIMSVIHSGKVLTNEELIEALGGVGNGLLDIQRDHALSNFKEKKDVQTMMLTQVYNRKAALDSGLVANKREGR